MYRRYHRREFVSPDPLQFLYGYASPRDREIAGIVAACLAYGRVSQIVKSTAVVLNRLGPQPSDFLQNASLQELRLLFTGFRHRFATGAELGLLLGALKRLISDYGSLYNCFLAAEAPGSHSVVPALGGLVDAIKDRAGGLECHLLPSPARGSACKRLHLFLRWMVRSDDVDPGGWSGISPAKLIIPLDTHMHRIGSALGFTHRRQADIKTALEITEGFRMLAPEDPVRYDFALTRPGIRNDPAGNRLLAGLYHMKGADRT